MEHKDSGAATTTAVFDVDDDPWETESSSRSELSFDEDVLEYKDESQEGKQPEIPDGSGHFKELFIDLGDDGPSSTDKLQFSRTRRISTLPKNSTLCDIYQKWDVAEAIFKPGLGDDRTFVECKSLEKYLQEETCMLCQLLAGAVIESHEEDLDHNKLQHDELTIVNCGPYWGVGRLRPRGKSDPFYGYEGRCIFLLLASREAQNFLKDGKSHDLLKRALSDSWRQSSILVPLKLRYPPPGIGLLDAERLGKRYLDVKKVRLLLDEKPSSTENLSDDECQTDEGHSDDEWQTDEEEDQTPEERQQAMGFRSVDTKTMGIIEAALQKGEYQTPEEHEQAMFFRLVDTETMCIVEADLNEDFRYAALSYLWASSVGQPTCDLTKDLVAQLSVPQALKKDNQPLVIWDAMVLCQDLGIRYFWTDRLCAIQDDPQDLASQISGMDQIYERATVTIVDIVDHNYDTGLPGVRGRPRRSSTLKTSFKFGKSHNMAEAIDQSVWNTRGWTFQERMMSQRLLFISNFQGYITGKTDYQENFGFVRDYHTHDATFRSTAHSPSNIISFQWNYVSLVEHYTRRSLTHGKDILAAFTGIANVISRQCRTEHLYGLFADHLDQYLLWGYMGSRGRRQDPCICIPSWSWAAWDGSAWYHSVFEDFHQDGLEIGKLVTFYAVRPQTGLSKLNIKETWFNDYDGVNVPRKLTNDYLGYGQTRYWSDTPDQDWRSCPHNPWTMLKHQVPHVDTSKLALEYSGALVFNTTVTSLGLSPLQEHFPLKDYEKRPAGSTYPSGVIFILHNNGRKIGYIMRVDVAWAKAWLAPEKKYDFIALSAGNFPESIMADPQSATEPLLQLFDDEVKISNPSNCWTLNVMLIERDEQNPAVCRRLAIGVVLMKFWRWCEPRWEAIVLA